MWIVIYVDRYRNWYDHDETNDNMRLIWGIIWTWYDCEYEEDCDIDVCWLIYM